MHSLNPLLLNGFSAPSNYLWAWLDLPPTPLVICWVCISGFALACFRFAIWGCDLFTITPQGDESEGDKKPI